ncbi:alcohol dehydrogenase catalytic domain-containing protein [Streptomyces sp. INA 01156]
MIEQVGPGIEHLAVGDHVVFSFLPACGRCRWCASGRSNLCDYGQFLMEGSMISGGYRAHARARTSARSPSWARSASAPSCTRRRS